GAPSRARDEGAGEAEKGRAAGERAPDLLRDLDRPSCALQGGPDVAAELGQIDPELRRPSEDLLLAVFAREDAGAIDLDLSLLEPAHLEEDPATHHREPDGRIQVRLAEG